MKDAEAIAFPDATRTLAEFFSELTYDSIPKDVVAKIKLSLLDSLGCCIHGATLPWTRQVAGLAQAEGAAPVASLFGSGKKTSVSLAALVNGTAGHAFELDDIHKESIIHPGSLATPVALAFAQARGKCTGRDLVTAMVAGYELGVRVGNAATMRLFFRGFHPQGTSGVFVAAAAAAKMLELDPVKFQHALGIAGSQGAGLMAAQEGAMVKRLHSGRAAQSGVYSALLAQVGFTGILDVLEAPYGGFLSSLSENPNLERLTDGLGATWEILNVGYKPHACVTSIHAALDGLATIMKEQGLAAGDIVSIDAGLSHMTHVHCAWEYKAQGVTAAQMNLFFCMSLIALHGNAFTAQFNENGLNEPGIIDFITRIQANVDSEIESMGPAFRHAARITVTDRFGNRHQKLVLHRRGSPENPLAPADITDKFKNVVSGCLPEKNIDHLTALISGFDELTDISEVLELIFEAYI
jgi:2-methylcitrate dehydratase PrpD